MSTVTENVTVKFGAMPTQIRASILKVMTGIGYDLANYIKTSKLSGQVLKVRTGQLRAAVGNETTQNDNTTETKVAVPGDRVPYARAQEYGASITIPPISGKLMVFQGKDGGTVFTTKRRGYQIHLPERSYMRSGLSDRAPHYVQQINDAVKGVV